MSDAVAVPRVDPDRAAATRSRILAAARAEFAASGFGGGRVERIASGAGVNKERIYAYFTDKRGLFVATIASAVREVAETVGPPTDDLAAFAGRMFDFMAEHPETLRLLSWARLEASEPMAAAAEHLVDLSRPEHEIARWQAEGRISRQWDAHDLVVVIWGLAEAAHMVPFQPTGPDAAAIEQRRRRLVAHAAGLLAQHDEPAAAPGEGGDRG